MSYITYRRRNPAHGKLGGRNYFQHYCQRFEIPGFKETTNDGYASFNRYYRPSSPEAIFCISAHKFLSMEVDEQRLPPTFRNFKISGFKELKCDAPGLNEAKGIYERGLYDL